MRVMDLDDKVCYLLFHVSRRKLENFVRRERPKVPSQLSQCGGGRHRLRLVHSVSSSQIFHGAGGATELEELTPAEYELRRGCVCPLRRRHSAAGGRRRYPHVGRLTRRLRFPYDDRVNLRRTIP